jgi:hypothetical protein
MKIKELFILVCLFFIPSCTSVHNITYNYNNEYTSNLTSLVLPTVKVNENSGAGVVIKIVKGELKDKVYILTAAHVLTKIKIVNEKISFPPPPQIKLPTTQPNETSIIPNSGLGITGEKDLIILSYTKRIDLNETNVEFYVYDNNGKVIEKVREQAKVVKRNKDLDLGLLLVETRPNLATVSRMSKVSPKIGDTLYSVGTAGIRPGTPVLTKGKHGGWHNDKGIMKGIYTGGTFYGDSGGPVYNNSFELVGIILAVRNPAWHIGFYLNITDYNLLD